MKYKQRRNAGRNAKPRSACVELYFNDLEGASRFYRDGLDPEGHNVFCFSKESALAYRE